MAAMNDANKAKIARIFARRIYNVATSNLAHDNIVAAATALDNALEGLPAALPNAMQSVVVNLNLVLPDPFKTTATIPQKSAFLAILMGVKYGYITTGGE